MQKAVIFVAATFLTQIFSSFFTQWLKIFVPPMPLPTSVFVVYANFTEIFFLLITLSVIAIWVRDLRRSSLMHSNLKFVCFATAFHIGTASILEITLNIDKHIPFKDIPIPVRNVIVVIHGCLRMHYVLDPFAAALERGLATLKVANYEKVTSQTRWCVFMFVKEIVGIISFYILSSPGAIIFAILWILLLLFTIITGIILYRVNLRSYKTRIGTLHLTTRYQTVENIRCLKPVLIYSFLSVIQQAIAFVLLFITFVHFSRGNYIEGSNAESLINLMVAIFSISYPLSFLAYSSRIRKLLKNRFKFRPRSSVSPKTTAAVPVLSVMGKVLTSKNEQNIYFSQFNTAWK